MARLPTLDEVEQFNQELRNARRENRAPRYRDPREVYAEDPNREDGYLIERTEEEISEYEKQQKDAETNWQENRDAVVQAYQDNAQVGTTSVLPTRSSEVDENGDPVIEVDPDVLADPNLTPKVEVPVPNLVVGTPEYTAVNPPVREDAPGATELILTDDVPPTPAPGGEVMSDVTQDIQPDPEGFSTAPTTPEQDAGPVNESTDNNPPTPDNPAGTTSVAPAVDNEANAAAGINNADAASVDNTDAGTVDPVAAGEASAPTDDTVESQDNPQQ